MIMAATLRQLVGERNYAVIAAMRMSMCMVTMTSLDPMKMHAERLHRKVHQHAQQGTVSDPGRLAHAARDCSMRVYPVIGSFRDGLNKAGFEPLSNYLILKPASL